MDKKRIIEILHNHAQETVTLNAQLISETEAMRSELSEIILDAAYHSGGDSEIGVRVQSTPKRDAMTIRAIEARAEVRERRDKSIKKIEEQIAEIRKVQDAIYNLDSDYKCVLLALYYPYRSYEKAMKILFCSKSTLIRKKREAIEKLVKEINKRKMNTNDTI